MEEEVQESKNEKATLVERLFIILFSAARKDLVVALLIVSVIAHIFTINLAMNAYSEKAAIEKDKAQMQEDFRKEMYEIIKTQTGKEVLKQVAPIKKTVDDAAEKIDEQLNQMNYEKGN